MSRVVCEGWWEQEGFGRQPMERLQLSFDEGQVSGSGTDIVGPFHFTGRLDGGNALLLKQYVGRHHVDYLGTFDGEGTLSGNWRIGQYEGSWMIRTISVVDESHDREATQQALDGD